MADQSKQRLVADLLERNPAPCDIRALREVASGAIKARAERALLFERTFRRRLESAVHRADADEDMVLTLAELGRLHQSPGGKAEQDWLVCLAEGILSRRLPASFQFGDGDQRRHAAVAAEMVGQRKPTVVTAAVLAKAAWEEEKADNARAVWIRALLSQASITGLFVALAAAPANSGQEKESGKNRSRRLRGLLQSVNHELPHARSADDSMAALCAAFADFVDGAFVGTGEPGDYPTAEAAVEELLHTAFQLLRCQFRLGTEAAFYNAFRLGTEAAFYNALSGAGKWLPSGGWRRIVSQSESIRQLRTVLLDGLLLLLEQGKPDPDLLAAHLSLSPGKQAAEQERRAAARKSKQLSPALKNWLRTGGRESPIAETGEFGETDDLSAAMAMIVVSRLRQQTAGGIDAMLDDIRFKAPIHAGTIEDLLGLARDLAGRLDQLADRRQLRLFGEPGEVVDFSPYAYRLPEGAPAVRRVRVESPGVEKRGRSASKIVVPALVSAAA